MKIFILSFVLLALALSFAQPGGGAPWSLAEWLATRDRMKWSDMRLTLNNKTQMDGF